MELENIFNVVDVCFIGRHTRGPVWITSSTPGGTISVTPPPRLCGANVSRADPYQLPQEANPSLQNGPWSVPATYFLLRPKEELVHFSFVGLHRAVVPIIGHSQGVGNSNSNVCDMEELESGSIHIQDPAHERGPVRKASDLFS